MGRSFLPFIGALAQRLTHVRWQSHVHRPHHPPPTPLDAPPPLHYSRHTECPRSPSIDDRRSPAEDAITRYTRGHKAQTRRAIAALLPGGDGHDPDADALAPIAGLAGAILVARALDDPALSDRTLAAARVLYPPVRRLVRDNGGGVARSDTRAPAAVRPAPRPDTAPAFTRKEPAMIVAPTTHRPVAPPHLVAGVA